MNKIWALGFAPLLLSVGLQQGDNLLFAASPQQSCRQSAVEAYKRCTDNACTSAGGHSDGAGTTCRIPPENTTQLKTYHDLVAQCTQQENDSLKYCK